MWSYCKHSLCDLGHGSRRQCCVWGCHNRKGRCPENIEGIRVCGCPKLLGTSCPRSGELLTLHYIIKMPAPVKRFVTTKINRTRQGPYGGTWKPSAESCICNMHYKDFNGPSRRNNNIIPCYFKQGHQPSSVRQPRRILSRFTTHEDDAVVEHDMVTACGDDAVVEEDMAT